LNREFLSKIFLANKGALLSYLRRLGADYDTAEDLSHEVFLRLYEKSQKGLEAMAIESIPPLMMGIGRNLFFRHLRRAGKVRFDFSGAEIPALVQGKRRELMLVFDSILSGDELPDREKEILYLRFSDGRKLKEIAEIVKIDEKTVRSCLEKGVKVIRKVFQKEGWTWEDWT